MLCRRFGIGFSRATDSLFEHCFRALPMSLLYFRGIGCPLELPGLEGFQEFTLVLIQSAHLAPK
jgi:hypothetical protein